MKRLLSVLLFATTLLAQDKPTDYLNKELPSWLKFSGEFRARLEGYTGGGFKPDTSDAYYLNRIRVNLLIQPVSWIKVFAQTQDSRVFFKNTNPPAPPYQNTWDLRQGYLELGESENGAFGVRVGRQELNFGEQRLVGSSDWNNTARSFDAVRATVHVAGVRLDAFSSSVVVATDGAFDHHRAGDDLHGVYGSINKLLPNTTIEPYILWRVSPRLRNEAGAIANLSEFTNGVHWVGKLPHGFDYGTEMAVQRGSLGSDSIASWAGHWVVGYTAAKLRYKPRFLVEYNYASGDDNAKDGIRGTFDQLYPTAHNKTGLADQVGWKNIKDLRTGVEIKPFKRVSFAGMFHDWYLADPHDALYTTASAAIARNPAGILETHVGEELDGVGMYALNSTTSIGFGFGHIFPGAFLQKATPGKTYNFPYVMFTYGF